MKVIAHIVMALAMYACATLYTCQLGGCATPLTVMTNPETGQAVRCGGTATGAMMGGIIGYHIQESNDRNCVNAYLELGFQQNP